MATPRISTAYNSPGPNWAKIVADAYESIAEREQRERLAEEENAAQAQRQGAVLQAQQMQAEEQREFQAERDQTNRRNQLEDMASATGRAVEMDDARFKATTQRELAKISDSRQRLKLMGEQYRPEIMESLEYRLLEKEFGIRSDQDLMVAPPPTLADRRANGEIEFFDEYGEAIAPGGGNQRAAIGLIQNQDGTVDRFPIPRGQADQSEAAAELKLQQVDAKIWAESREAASKELAAERKQQVSDIQERNKLAKTTYETALKAWQKDQPMIGGPKGTKPTQPVPEDPTKVQRVTPDMIEERATRIHNKRATDLGIGLPSQPAGSQPAMPAAGAAPAPQPMPMGGAGPTTAPAVPPELLARAKQLAAKIRAGQATPAEIQEAAAIRQQLSAMAGQ